MIIPVFMSTETPDWNWANVLRHWIPGDPFQPEQLTVEYYRMKYAVANFIKPKTICEIGVRAGYSAAAFLQAGHTKKYVGIDFNAGTHGGIPGYTDYAVRTLSVYNVETIIHNRVDSQTLDILPDGPFDLLHVDGDHSAEGAYNDIKLGIKSAKWILVDDTDYIDTVSFGTFKAISDFKIEEAYYVYDKKYRGNILIKNPNI